MADKHTVAQLGEVGVHDQDGREHQHNAQDLDCAGGLGIDANTDQNGRHGFERSHDRHLRRLEVHREALHIEDVRKSRRNKAKAREQQNELRGHCRGYIGPRSRKHSHKASAKDKAPKRHRQRMQRLGGHAAKHSQQRTAKSGDHTRRDAPSREMETGQVPARHREHATHNVKDDGDELVGGHALAIKHAAEHDAKHRRGIEQHRGRGHAHLAHALVIAGVGDGQTDDTDKCAGDELFRTCLEQRHGTRGFSLTSTSLATHEYQNRSHQDGTRQQAKGRHALRRNAQGGYSVNKDADGSPHEGGDQHQRIAHIASLQRSLLGSVSNMFHATL